MLGRTASALWLILAATLYASAASPTCTITCQAPCDMNCESGGGPPPGGGGPPSGGGTPPSGTAYYVSLTGSDSNNGTDPTTPWKTLHKVNLTNFPANSVIQFAGGQTFSDECLVFKGYSGGNISSGGNLGDFRKRGLI